MAQLVIKTVDRKRGEFYADAQDYRRGDVIAVYPDTYVFEGDVLKLPIFRIVKIPTMTFEEAQQFVAPQVLDANDRASPKTLARRAISFDLDGAFAVPGFKAYIADDGRKEPVFTLDMPLPAVRTLRKARAKVSDPVKVLGAP